MKDIHQQYRKELIEQKIMTKKDVEFHESLRNVTFVEKIKTFGKEFIEGFSNIMKVKKKEEMMEEVKKVKEDKLRIVLADTWLYFDRGLEMIGTGNLF